ncbi:hypothetical protein Tco_0325213 [Tanacetum coccineum]
MGKGKDIIVLSSDSEDINKGPSKGNVPKEDINEGGPELAKLFKYGPPPMLLRWYGYADVDEYLEDPFSDSPEKETKDKSCMDTFSGSTYEESSDNETTVGTTDKDLIFNEDTIEKHGMKLSKKLERGHLGILWTKERGKQRFEVDVAGLKTRLIPWGRGWGIVSSSSFIIKGSVKSHQHDDDDDVETSRASTPSPTTYLNSLGSLNYQNYQIPSSSEQTDETPPFT